MSANRIVILEVETQFPAHYIADVFWTQDIGKVSSITLIPQIYNGKITNIAYVYFNSFNESEAAKEFLEAMKADGCMFCHNHSDPQNNIWVLEKNNHHSGELYVGPYTQMFTSDFFEGFVTGDDSFLRETIDVNRPHYIVGLDSKSYHIDEALERLWVLDEQAINGRYEDFIDEMYHFTTQIALYYFTRGQGDPIMYDILASLDVSIGESENKIRREVGQGRDEYDAMQKFIKYCKPRVDFIHQMRNSSTIQREYAMGTEVALTPEQFEPLTLADLTVDSDDIMPPRPSLLSAHERQTAMTDAEIEEMLENR